jgi:hypothetical protein
MGEQHSESKDVVESLSLLRATVIVSTLVSKCEVQDKRIKENN